MVGLENTLQLLKVNLKVVFLNNTVLAVLLLALTPIIFSIRSLDYYSAAKICEQFVAIIGVILLVPIFSTEEEKGIRETVEAKFISQVYVYIIRILTAVLILAALINLIVLLFIMCGGTFHPVTLISGTFASAFFLGALGLFIASVSCQLIAGYMVPIVYFIFDLMTKGKYTKDFFLFSLTDNSFKEKYYLLGAAMFITVLSLAVYVIRKKCR
jgi:hypothetical protein